MLSKEENSRYQRQIILPEIGQQGQEKLKAARVLVIGAGGLGCPVLQYLAAAGVGHIGIADGDVVELTNLQRQVLFTPGDIDQPKALVAAAKIRAINSDIGVIVHTTFITNDNALEILAEYDVIIDGSDNFPTRYLVNDACVMLGKPLVFGAIYKYEGQVSVFNYLDGPTYRCIFPEAPGEGESPSCADIGVIATLPGIIGCIQANEAIKIITGIGTPLSGKLLVMDTLTMETMQYSFKVIPANKHINTLQHTQLACSVDIINVNFSTLETILTSHHNLQIIDVRDPWEHEEQLNNGMNIQSFQENGINILHSLFNGINIPTYELPMRYQSLSTTDPVLVFCANGVRSHTAAKLLAQYGFKQIYNLKNGING
jgi:molybdopterin/thiamine biosynthesis adenylyltransferase/rhodanese-related sulfurtransferase